MGVWIGEFPCGGGRFRDLKEWPPARTSGLLGSLCDPRLGRVPHGSGITLPAAGMQAFRFRDREEWPPARTPGLLGSLCDPRLGRAPHGSGITLPVAGMQAFRFRDRDSGTARLVGIKRFRDREEWPPARTPGLLGSLCDPRLGRAPHGSGITLPVAGMQAFRFRDRDSGTARLVGIKIVSRILCRFRRGGACRRESYVVFVEEAHVVDLVF